MRKIKTMIICISLSLSLILTSSVSAFSENQNINGNISTLNYSNSSYKAEEKDIPNFSVIEEDTLNESQDEKDARQKEEIENANFNEGVSGEEEPVAELEVAKDNQDVTVTHVGNGRGNATPVMRRVIYLSPQVRPKLNFEEMMNLQNYDCLDRVFEISQLFQESLDANTLDFNLDKAVESVRGRRDLILDDILNQNINKRSAQPTVVAEELVNYLGNLGVNITPEKKIEYSNIIASAFSNLKNKKQGAWIFWNKATAKACSYNYNILFAIQDESTRNRLVTVPVALKITVNVVKEKVLFIKIKEKHSYNVNIKALRVTDNKDSSVVQTRLIRRLPDRPCPVREREPRPNDPVRRDPVRDGESRPNDPVRRDPVRDGERRPNDPVRRDPVRDGESRPNDPVRRDPVRDEERRPDDPVRRNPVRDGERRSDQPVRR